MSIKISLKFNLQVIFSINHSCHPPFLAYRCSAHAADGTLKRLAMSKTINVDEVTTFCECIRTVIKHSQCSVKDKEICDTRLVILELREIHPMSWCAT